MRRNAGRDASPQVSSGGHMGRMLQYPRYNVVSLRVTDEELSLLQELAESRRMSISKLMRFAMYKLAEISN